MIDVLIPVYNTEKTVRESLDSILGQTFRDFRVVVVDDGSTDRTPDILRDVAAGDPRVTVVTKENGGIVDAMNLGLTHCTAEFIARHDGDDVAFPDRFEKQLAYLRAHPDCVAVGGNAWHIDEKGRRMASRSWMGGDVTGDREATPSVEPYIVHPFLMARRSAFEAVGGYRHVFNSEDTDLYWRMLELGRLHNLDAFLGLYRMHSGSVSSGNVLVGAVASQLAAISAGRRAQGREDLSFSKDASTRWKAAPDFRTLLTIAAEGLDPDEAAYLRLAATAKLIELRTYRNFRPALSDIKTVASVLKAEGRRMTPRERRKLIRHLGYIVRPKFGLKGAILRWRDRVWRMRKTGGVMTAA